MQEIEVTNINTRWQINIFENIKNLENIERTTREGCSSIIDYLNIPSERRHNEIIEAQYKNLRFFITEFHLLLGDLTPVLIDLDETKYNKFTDEINKLIDIMDDKNLFIKTIYLASSNKRILKLTPLFSETLKHITYIKLEVFKLIKNMLYVPKKEKEEVIY